MSTANDPAKAMVSLPKRFLAFKLSLYQESATLRVARPTRGYRKGRAREKRNSDLLPWNSLKKDGKVVGAIGVSGGSGDQDHAVAEAGAAAF